MRPSPSCSLQYRAAAAIAGAVLRPTGSSMTGRCSLPISESCERTRAMWCSLQMTSGEDIKSRPSSRMTVCWIIVRFASMSERNCLGTSGVESGHRREPEPPERITGNIVLLYHAWRRRASGTLRVLCGGRQHCRRFNPHAFVCFRYVPHVRASNRK